MSNHQKRLSVPNSWPVERKEETYTTNAGAGPHGADGVPLLIVLRDVLGYVDSRKEARVALEQDSVRVNGTAVADVRRPIGMFDILAFAEREEYYRVFPDAGGRLSLTPIDAEAAGSKLGKIEGKTQVPGGDTQLALHDGQTLLVEDPAEYATTDSIVVSNDDDTVVAHFTYEEGALVTAVRGAHAGRIGRIEAIEVTPGSSANNVRIEGVDGPDFETVEAYVVVIDENFTAEDDAEPTDGDGSTPPTEDEAEADDGDATEDEAEADDGDATEDADDASDANEATAQDEDDVADDAPDADADAGGDSS